MTNGTDLREQRRTSGVTVTSLAKAIGVARQTLHTYERLADVETQLGQEFVTKWREAIRELATPKGDG